jgi:hypothetical protein
LVEELKLWRRGDLVLPPFYDILLLKIIGGQKMNSSNFRFVLDLQSTQSQISIPVTKGDTARVWYISLSDGGQPYIIEEGCLARIEIKRPTGTFLTDFCAIKNNTTLIYDFSKNDITRQTAAVEGVHRCDIVITDAAENKIGAARFSMIVSDRVISSDDINLTDEDLTAVEAMIAAEASRQAAEKGRVDAEAKRAKAEEERILAEEARRSGVDQLLVDIEKAVTEASADIDEKMSEIDRAMEEGSAFLANVYTKPEVDALFNTHVIGVLNTEV